MTKVLIGDKIAGKLQLLIIGQIVAFSKWGRIVAFSKWGRIVAFRNLGRIAALRIAV